MTLTIIRQPKVPDHGPKVSPAELAAELAPLEAAIDAAEASIGVVQGRATALEGRTVSGGGLAAGGGDLTANRILTVPKATRAEAVARLLDDRAVTPNSLDAALDPIDAAILAAQANIISLDVELDRRAGTLDDVEAFGASLIRPGDVHKAYTHSLDGGDPDLLAPLAPALVKVRAGRGAVIEMTGEMTVASREYVTIEEARRYALRAAVHRQTDSPDPSNDGIAVGLAWYNHNKVRLSGGSAETLSEPLNDFVVSSGLGLLLGIVAREPVEGATTIIPPAGAVYARRFLRTYGGAHQTDLSILDIRDISDLPALGADLLAQANAAVAAGRAFATQAQLSGGAGVVRRETLALLQAVTDKEVGTLGEVYADPVQANIGTYRRTLPPGQTNGWTFESSATVSSVNARTTALEQFARDDLGFEEGDVSDFLLTWRLDDATGRAPIHITPQGELATRRRFVDPGDLEDYGGLYVYFFHGPNGELLLGLRKDGRWTLRLDAQSIANVVDDNIPEAEIRARGAARNIWGGQHAKNGLIRYLSNQINGQSYRFAFRRDRPAGVNWLDIDTFIEVMLGYGQSWRTITTVIIDALNGITNGVPDPSVARIPWLFEKETTLTATLADAVGPIATIGSNLIAGSVVDIRNYSPSQGIQIDRVSAFALARMRRAAMAAGTFPLRPVLTYGHGWPGTPWNADPTLGGLEPGATVDNGNTPWANGVTLAKAAIAQAKAYGREVLFRAVGWTHGPAEVGYRAQLDEMLAAYTGINADPALAGKGFADIKIVTDQAASNAAFQRLHQGYRDQVEFAVDNPARIVNIGGRYDQGFIDNIHHTAFGTSKVAERDAYAKHRSLDLGQAVPVFRITSVSAVAGTNTVQFTTSQPIPGGSLVFDTASIEPATSTWRMNDEAANSVPWSTRLGFCARTGVDLAALAPRTITGVTVAGTSGEATLSGAAHISGHALGFSYAWHGPGFAVEPTLAALNSQATVDLWHVGARGYVYNDGPNNGTYDKIVETFAEAGPYWVKVSGDVAIHSGIWGNLKMAGPPSLLWPGATVDTFLCAHYAEIIIP